MSIQVKILLLTFLVSLSRICSSSLLTQPNETIIIYKNTSQQPYRFDHLTGYKMGIPDYFNTGQIIQDTLGFLWFFSNPFLVKFDGYEFKSYKPEEVNYTQDLSTPPNTLSCMYVDEENNLWCATRFGLSLYNRNLDTFINYHLFPDMGDLIHHEPLIQEDKHGNLWLVTINGLFAFDKASISTTSYKSESGSINTLSTDSLLSIVKDNNNNFWISTINKGIEKFDPEKKIFTHFRHTPDSNSIGSDKISCICKDNSGILWIGLDSGRIDEFNPVTGKFIHYSLDQPVSMEFICADKTGQLWITNGGDIIAFDKNKTTYSLLSNEPKNPWSPSLNNNNIFEDRSGVIWIATSNRIVDRFVRQKQLFRYYNFDEYPGQVRAIVEDSSLNLWVGTHNGLNKLNCKTGKYKHYSVGTNPDNISGGFVYSLLMENEYTLWVGTNYGLNKMDIKKNTFKHYFNNPEDSNSISGNFINSICKDSHGILWIASTDGLYKMEKNGETFTRYKHIVENPSSLGSNDVRTIYEDNNNILWCGSIFLGVSRYNRENETFKYFFDENSIIGATRFAEDTKGQFWFTSNSTGLNLFDRTTGKARNFGRNFGLPTNYACDMLVDNSGKLWISTHNGLSCFDPKSETFRNFDKEDGLINSDFYIGASCKSKNGTFYFGCTNGIMAFNPDSIMINTVPPKTVITGFKIFNQLILPKENSPLEKNINVADKIVLSYRDNSFSFEFAALDYNNPARNQYAYMMEGFDNEWVKSGNARTASYTNLDPGEYTFRVKGSNNDGIWDEKGTSIKIIITPQWWQTWWFRGFSLIIVLSGLVYSRHRKLSKIRKEMVLKNEFTKQLINTQEAERKRIAGELHDSLGQNLLVIKNKLLLRMQKEKDRELDDISNLATGAIDEVRSISHNLSPYEIERLGLTEAIESIIDNVKNSTNLIVKHRINNIDNIFSKQDEINFYRIIQECMTNIIKHANTKTVEIRIMKEPGYIETFIKDDGSGFDLEKLKSRNKGMGLAGIQERVNILNGELSINSRPGTGTEVKILIKTTKL